MSIQQSLRCDVFNIPINSQQQNIFVVKIFDCLDKWNLIIGNSLIVDKKHRVLLHWWWSSGKTLNCL